MLLGGAYSLHIKHMVTSFTPLMQAFAGFNVPSSKLSKTSKNTHFLNPLQLLYNPITSSSFWHSLAVIIFHMEIKFLIPLQGVSYTSHLVSTMINRGRENCPKMFQATLWVLIVYSVDTCAFCHLASFHPSTDNCILSPALRSRVWVGFTSHQHLSLYSQL